MLELSQPNIQFIHIPFYNRYWWKERYHSICYGNWATGSQGTSKTRSNLPVEDKYFRYPLQFCQPIMDITLSKILTWFHPVICPLTNRIMHMDKTGFLWPCIGCTRPSSTSHCMYCKMSNHYGDPEFMLKIDPNTIAICYSIQRLQLFGFEKNSFSTD